MLDREGPGRSRGRILHRPSHVSRNNPPDLQWQKAPTPDAIPEVSNLPAATFAVSVPVKVAKRRSHGAVGFSFPGHC